MGFRRGGLFYSAGGELLLYVKKYHKEVSAFPLLWELLFKILYREPAQWTTQRSDPHFPKGNLDEYSSRNNREQKAKRHRIPRKHSTAFEP